MGSRVVGCLYNKAMNRSDISRRGRLVPRMVGYRRFYHPLHSQIQTFPVARLTRALYRLRSAMLGSCSTDAKSRSAVIGAMLERARSGFGHNRTRSTIAGKGGSKHSVPETAKWPKRSANSLCGRHARVMRASCSTSTGQVARIWGTEWLAVCITKR